MSDSLFDVDPSLRLQPEPVEQLSADRRRTIRQRQAVADGVHPLALAVPGVHIHPQAKELGLTCGSCRFRQKVHGGARSYPKCVFGERRPLVGWPRTSHGAATDVRAWWPACRDHQPTKETTTNER